MKTLFEKHELLIYGSETASTFLNHYKELENNKFN